MPQTQQAVYVSAGDSIPWTPGSALSGGDVVAIGSNNLGIANGDIAANVKGSLRMYGLFWVKKETGAIAAGDDVHWNSSGNPVSGSAGTGAANDDGTGVYMGLAVAEAASGDAEVLVLKFQNGEGVS